MIHQYKLNGFNIVLDVGSGSVHVVDGLVYDIIAVYETADREQLIEKLALRHQDIGRSGIEEALGEVEALIASGKLFSDDTFADLSDTDINKDNIIKALCLHVSHACNLTCGYCFAGDGRYHGPSALMDLETGLRAIDFLVENSGKRRNLEVDFFGGEPLLNWETTREIVRYARSIEKRHGKNFRFTLTTNGLLIDDDVIEFSNREMANVVLSLDGRPEVHDRWRRTPDGLGSYGRIVPKFKRFVEKRGNRNYYIRGTFTHENTDFTEDILHMADLGFTELSMEPVVSRKGDGFALTEDDLPVLFEQYERLAREMLRRGREGRGFTFYHFMLDLKRGPCIYKRIAGCGAGSEYLAVTPAGELYPCHQFVGETEYKMGDIWSGVANTPKLEAFKRCNAYSRDECRGCWARLYCAGGCAANAFHASGSIEGVYDYGCRLFKKRIECALMLKAAEAVEKAGRETGFNA